MLTLALWVLYPIVIQAERGGAWRVLYPAIPLMLAVDVLANYTELAVLTLDWPQRGEWTFSQRLARLRRRADWRGDFALYTSRVLDAIAPSGRHI